MKPLRILFIHQNFPAQFVHVAGELQRRGHEVVALAVRGHPIPGVRFFRYAPAAPERPSEIDLARDFEVKIARGRACAAAMGKLEAGGFHPDVVVAHPGWGEALFCKDVWPRARLVVYAEFFYAPEGSDYGFDPEFSSASDELRMRLRLKNTVHLHALAAADRVYTPTRWQCSQLPPEFRAKTVVAFDGIDTALVRPDPRATVRLAREQVQVTAGDEVITFVNRNLEPYRGFHRFMRALPEILRRRPAARCIIVGGDEVSYGAPPPGGGTWREYMLREVGGRLPVERVHFLGRVPYADYVRLLQLAACHVYLTYPFVLSWSCLEAMSAGAVVVASRTGPVQEVIEHGRNGLLFDFFDTDALTGQVVDVLANPGSYRAIGRAARETVVARYDLRAVSLAAQVAVIAG
ncbi:glycosyltransferase family 4 protein [Ramlibacter sp.]|uniref:glycosyltransferase family 4 protein n=1 Tax=Ramlibacter sp. TaxID=1917967 RepID=UPI002BCEB15D|nr:glycosyltransferase family 4 protein [Ramlibacter sp.]HWI83576.1 glycosyltransferase family 4 protein [Ramlibacter sp.]